MTDLNAVLWFTYIDRSTTGIHVEQKGDKTVLFQLQGRDAVLVFVKEPGEWRYLGIAYKDYKGGWTSSPPEDPPLHWATRAEAVDDLLEAI